MQSISRHLKDWWEALFHPQAASGLVLDTAAHPGLARFLALVIVLCYGLYGFSMGIFRGWYAGVMSGLKLPLLYVLTVGVCFPPFYVINNLHGPRLQFGQCLRLFLLAVSADAVAVTSYTLFSFFFTLTTSREGYTFLVLMHVVVFSLAGMASLVEINLIFRSAGMAVGRRIGPAVLAAWGVLYAFVGTQMAWTLRPWIGSWSLPYAPFRPIESSFVQALWNLIF